MLTINDALNRILETANTINADRKVVIDTVSLEDALGLTLAQDQISEINVPPEDNSAMDGYAINCDGLLTNAATSFTISQTITAGCAPRKLSIGTAARILTGAEIPLGANAVVMQEQCEIKDNAGILPVGIIARNNVRTSGQDIQVGDRILQQRPVFSPQDIVL